MTADIVTFVFNIIISLVFFVIKIVLLPIDLLIQQFIPGVSEAFTAVGDFLSLIATGLGWAISAIGVPYTAVALVATYLIFKLSFPIIMWGIKLAIKWYVAIKP